MSELVSNTRLIAESARLLRTLAVLDEQTKKLRDTGRIIARWFETSPREKARRAKIAFVSICTATYREALALFLIGTIDTENARPLLGARLRNWLHAHAPPHGSATKTEQARVMT